MSRGGREGVQLGHERAGLLREVAIPIRDPAGRVRPPAKRDAVVVDGDVGVVVLGLGELTHAVHEPKRFDEVRELECPLERVVDLCPTFAGHDASIYDRRRV